METQYHRYTSKSRTSNALQSQDLVSTPFQWIGIENSPTGLADFEPPESPRPKSRVKKKGLAGNRCRQTFTLSLFALILSGLRSVKTPLLAS